MSHQAQLDFVKYVKNKHPYFFDRAKVLEVGSLDINGSIRQFFTNCEYIGVDLAPGKSVDVVARGEELQYPDNAFHVVASCECFEHNEHWAKTFNNMYRMVTNGGLVLFSCATIGRREHGTTRTSPQDSPFTNDYYKNLTVKDFENSFNFPEMFSAYQWEVNDEIKDLYFFGFKR